MKQPTTYLEFIKNLSETELEDYASRCHTTAGYLLAHLKHARKIPGRDLLNALWQESGGRVTRQMILDHFYPEEKAAS